MWCHYWNSDVLSCGEYYVDIHQPLTCVAHDTKTLCFAFVLPLFLPLNWTRIQLEPIFQHFCGMPPAPILHLRMVVPYPPPLILVCIRTCEWLRSRGGLGELGHFLHFDTVCFSHLSYYTVSCGVTKYIPCQTIWTLCWEGGGPDPLAKTLYVQNLSWTWSTRYCSHIPTQSESTNLPCLPRKRVK